jgi:hypothetical protein
MPKTTAIRVVTISRVRFGCRVLVCIFGQSFYSLFNYYVYVRKLDNRSLMRIYCDVGIK